MVCLGASGSRGCGCLRLYSDYGSLTSSLPAWWPWRGQGDRVPASLRTTRPSLAPPPQHCLSSAHPTPPPCGVRPPRSAGTGSRWRMTPRHVPCAARHITAGGVAGGRAMSGGASGRAVQGLAGHRHCGTVHNEGSSRAEPAIRATLSVGSRGVTCLQKRWGGRGSRLGNAGGSPSRFKRRKSLVAAVQPTRQRTKDHIYITSHHSEAQHSAPRSF